MQSLLSDVQSGMYDGVVVELERLSRGNQIDQAEILEVFKKSATKIYTLNKVYDLASDNDFDEDFFEFGLFMSRREYKIIKRRLQRGKKQALKFVLIPHPTEADIVRTIFDKFVYQGLDAFEIIKWLHENNINPLRVDNWSCKALRRLLRNKTYIGYIAVDYVNGSPTRYIDGLHNGIIDIDTFNLAQEKLETKRTKIQYDRTLVNPLASILKCSKCGRTMQSRFSTNKHHYFLRCPNLKCDTVSNVLEPVEWQVIAEISECLYDYELYVENHGEEKHVS